MRFYARFYIFIALIFLSFCYYSKNFSNSLISAVKAKDTDYVRAITKYIPSQVTKEEFEKALFLAADTGDTKMFKLIAPYTSRKAHRKAYYILIDKSKVDL